MESLISSLLDYARLGNLKPMQLVDCNEIMKDIMEDVNNFISFSNAKVNHTLLPILKTIQ
jgi:hypothetical protein